MSLFAETPEGKDSNESMSPSRSCPMTSLLVFKLSLCACAVVHVCITVHLEITQESHFSPSNVWVAGLSSGYQVWQQAPFPTEPSHWPSRPASVLVFRVHIISYTPPCLHTSHKHWVTSVRKKLGSTGWAPAQTN